MSWKRKKESLIINEPGLTEYFSFSWPSQRVKRAVNWFDDVVTFTSTSRWNWFTRPCLRCWSWKSNLLWMEPKHVSHLHESIYWRLAAQNVAHGSILFSKCRFKIDCNATNTEKKKKIKSWASLRKLSTDHDYWHYRWEILLINM